MPSTADAGVGRYKDPITTADALMSITPYCSAFRYSAFHYSAFRYFAFSVSALYPPVARSRM